MRTSVGPQLGIGADDKSLLVWDHDLLVGWQLPPSGAQRTDLPTAGGVRQFVYLPGGEELITVSGEDGAWPVLWVRPRVDAIRYQGAASAGAARQLRQERSTTAPAGDDAGGGAGRTPRVTR